MNQTSRQFAVLRRLETSEGDVRVGREYVYSEDAKPVAIDMGSTDSTAWYELPLPACPDCGGEVVWAEAGLVPGARECTACGSRFTVEAWEQPERLEALALQWGRARGKVKDEDVLAFDAARAKQMGLPVMVALLELQQRIESANGPISPGEMSAELAPIIQLARGETQKRAANIGATIDIPGVVMLAMGDVL